MGFSGFFDWFSESAWSVGRELDSAEELIPRFAGRVRDLAAATVPMGRGCDETLLEVASWLDVFEE